MRNYGQAQQTVLGLVQHNLVLIPCFLLAEEVVIVSILVLVALFSIQRFGTAKVGFLFAPVLTLWFFSLAFIGVHNIFKHDTSVLRAFNPAYIYYFFKKNTKAAWSSLGGCVLCITGTSFSWSQLFGTAGKDFSFFSSPCIWVWPLFTHLPNNHIVP